MISGHTVEAKVLQVPALGSIGAGAYPLRLVVDSQLSTTLITSSLHKYLAAFQKPSCNRIVPHPRSQGLLPHNTDTDLTAYNLQCRNAATAFPGCSVTPVGQGCCYMRGSSRCMRLAHQHPVKDGRDRVAVEVATVPVSRDVPRRWVRLVTWSAWSTQAPPFVPASACAHGTRIPLTWSAFVAFLINVRPI